MLEKSQQNYTDTASFCVLHRVMLFCVISPVLYLVIQPPVGGALPPTKNVHVILLRKRGIGPFRVTEQAQTD